MLCRWLAVPVLAAFLLVIEAIAVNQGTLLLSRARAKSSSPSLRTLASERG